MRMNASNFRLSTVTVLLVLLVMPVCSHADTKLNPSTELWTVIRQAESTYLKPMGLDMATASNRTPLFLATALGLAMQRQMKYLDRHGEYEDRFDALMKQSLTFLAELAKAHGYRNPEDGTGMSETAIQLEFYEALNGESNPYFIDRFHIDPSSIDLPMMLAQVPEPEDPADEEKPVGAFHQKKDNALVLLGKSVDGPVEGLDMSSIGQSIPPPDVILGTWHHYSDPSRRVTVVRKGNAYQTSESEIRGESRDKYRVTAVYTFYPDSEAIGSVLGDYRKYKVKREYICEPKMNDYNCNNPITESTTLVGFIEKEGYYFISTNGEGIFSGWRKSR